MTSSLLARLWTAASDALSRLRATLLPLDVLTAKERRGVRACLRALEVFCRRLALTEALSLVDCGPARSPLRAAIQSTAPNVRAPSRNRPPRLRLWPRAKRMPVRITLLGPPTLVREIWRERARSALIARLARGRLRRKPAHIRLADRLDALERFLDAPRAGIRRLARKLRLSPKLAMQIALCKQPPSPHLAPERTQECYDLLWPLVLNSS